MEMDQNFEPRDYSRSTTNQVSMRETEGREKSNKFKTKNYSHFPFSTLILYHLEPQICISIKEWPLGEEQLNAENDYG